MQNNIELSEKEKLQLTITIARIRSVISRLYQTGENATFKEWFYGYASFVRILKLNSLEVDYDLLAKELLAKIPILKSPNEIRMYEIYRTKLVTFLTNYEEEKSQVGDEVKLRAFSIFENKTSLKNQAK